jgi:hypothetical protein
MEQDPFTGRPVGNEPVSNDDNDGNMEQDSLLVCQSEM